MKRPTQLSRLILNVARALAIYVFTTLLVCVTSIPAMAQQPDQGITISDMAVNGREFTAMITDSTHVKTVNVSVSFLVPVGRFYPLTQYEFVEMSHEGDRFYGELPYKVIDVMGTNQTLHFQIHVVSDDGKGYHAFFDYHTTVDVPVFPASTYTPATYRPSPSYYIPRVFTPTPSLPAFIPSGTPAIADRSHGLSNFLSSLTLPGDCCLVIIGMFCIFVILGMRDNTRR